MERPHTPEFWYTVYHTLFWLDCYLSPKEEGFNPPAPFTLSEYDPEGILPERVYTKEELLDYLDFCRKKCRETTASITEESFGELIQFGTNRLPRMEFLIYNMRHVQHHTGQLYLMLRQQIDNAPKWVRRAATEL